ncbi:uncharacterized protein LOC117342150 isoform X2 [Pecten maximus]|uniref:uncharacterized protein LOC117342150 isoform X2 n=1 Tax=Pecten maximus TaxID=6579 RepID=UPI00145873E0|nr:uncharacterized protein LOC117342150 isoform X2 [Pecten maximus]
MKMFEKGTSFIIFHLVLVYMNTSGESQLIGDEKKYVFLEQVVLERVRPAVLDMTKGLDRRVGRLEEEIKRILSELIAMKAADPSQEATSDCPTSGPRFDMDPTTLYRSWYLSRDNLTLFNTRPDNIYGLQRRPNGNRVYWGVQGSRVITNTQIIYFETEIYYRIKRDFSSTNLVFEVAFATETAIGKSNFVGLQMGAWSVNAYKSPTSPIVTLQVRSKGSVMHDEKISDSTAGTEKYLVLGFFINRVDRTIAVFDINMNRKVFTLTDVDGDQDLWPVFGVYNPYEVYAHLQLITQKDITTYPCGLSGK